MSREIIVSLATGAGLGLVSSTHCMLMCGPLALASRTRRGSASAWLYAGGRLASYSVLGSIAGSVGRVMAASVWTRWLEAGLSWLLAALLIRAGLRMLGSSRQRPPAAGLVQLGLRPRATGFASILVRLADEPLLLGAATALLPCGALLAALTASAALGSAGAGALAMATFAVLTGAALTAFGGLGGLLTSLRGRRALGGVLLVGAILMVIRPLALLRGDAAPSCHARTTANTVAEVR